ncbi:MULTISPECIES: PP_RS20740 family protein [Klebsiella pneumoniae complex]|nr:MULTISPECIES: hypothetical protein [Klebsiella]EKV8286285.1 hypothetical protein [Raoultella ornithinolytica]HBQ6589640.1 hypothetical protein [Klebsiella quasipneumoniae subsp. similipneumoniae]HDS4028868.1 hypothetical protein [Klebsiella pneumoniae subsp. pneumoniae]EIW8705498.1 hypothetical protein [Klebsiella pneumoniae]ELN9411299.1 hypothetical protein [Klebsiella pneumoniae]
MSDQEFFNDLFEDMQETPAGRLVKNNFLPWHHPRKHLVRLDQWVYYINMLLDKPFHGKDTIKYFSLPGDDLLDIRTIHEEICLRRNIKLHFLGFNDHESEQLREQNANISLNEVRALPFIDRNSEYHNNDILKIVSKDSLAYQRFKSFGDFDVINLDFCGSVTIQRPANRSPNHYNLLTKIIQLQNNRDKPWLLYLTTRIGSDHIHHEVLNQFKEHYSSNLNDENFRVKSHEIFNVFDRDSLTQSLGNCENFRKIVSTSLCKWLLSFSLSLTPKTTVKILDAMEYKVLPESEYPDMLSLALLFTPHPDQVQDPLGLAIPNARVERFQEPTIASYYIDRVNKCTDCDSYLLTSPNVKQAMVEKSANLLKSARFDTQEYLRIYG